MAINLEMLQEKAKDIRIDIIREIHSAGSGHPGGSLSAADIITYLYFAEMNVDPENPDKPGRDRFVLSKGHAAPALYAALAGKRILSEGDTSDAQTGGQHSPGTSRQKESSGSRYVYRFSGTGHFRSRGKWRWQTRSIIRGPGSTLFLATVNSRKAWYGKLPWLRLITGFPV